MAIVLRRGDEGVRPRKRPAKLAPTAGVKFAVRAWEIRGLRGRKGAADLSSSEARRRVKKRKSRRWKSRMREKEAAVRALPCFGGGGAVALHWRLALEVYTERVSLTMLRRFSSS